MAATCATCAPGPARPLCCSTRVRAQLEYFAPLLRHLNTARFAVIAPDLPGHGESRAPCAHHTANDHGSAAQTLSPGRHGNAKAPARDAPTLRPAMSHQ